MKLFQTLIFFFVVALCINGQGLKHISKEDTALNKPKNYNAPLFFSSPVFSLALTFSTIQDNYPESLHLKFGSSSNLHSIIEQNLDVSQIWKLGALKEDELKALRTVLRQVQLGGAVYLAYRHIKKYGFK